MASRLCRSGQEKYPYGYNGQMKVNEWAGKGNHTTALYWEYDTRTGRRANIDPKYKKFPSISPYVTNDDNPIRKFDEKGDEGILAVIGFAVGAGVSLVQSASDAGGLRAAFSKENRAKTIGHMLNAGVSGAIIGATNGASLLATSALVGGGQSMVDDLIDNKGDVSKISIKKTILSAGMSTATVGLRRYFGNVLQGSGNGFLGKLTGQLLEDMTGAYSSFVNWGVLKSC